MIKKKLPYNQKKVGDKIATAGEHVVYKYGDDQIIKFPAGPIYYANAKDARAKVINEVRLANKYLKEFIAVTELYTYEEQDKNKYCIIQEYIIGRPLELKDMQDDELQNQFKELMKDNDLMYLNSRYTLEFFGLRGLLLHRFFPRMENIIVTQENKIKIIDLGMISSLNMVSSSPILRWFIQWAVKKQAKLLREKYLVN